MSFCICMGPQPGQTLCPCALRGVPGAGGFAAIFLPMTESERVLDEIEALAAAEAKSGDGRALRTFKRLREAHAALPVRVKPRPMHEDNGA